MRGVLQIEQKSGHNIERNDRLFAVPRSSHAEHALKDVSELSAPIREELEKFFVATDELEDKTLKIIGWKDADTALKSVRKCAKTFAQKNAKINAKKNR